MTINGSDIFISYDGYGNPLHITYNGVAYAYVTNLQGDVVALLDSSGTAVVQYTYDAWGDILTCTGTMAATLGVHNPLRYRGYVYDTETGLYYLQSRYYNPEVGRFINADAFASTGQGLLGHNMFAYCGNNPVNRVDYTGQFWESLIDFIDGLGTEIGNAISSMAPAYAGSGLLAAADGPLLIGEIGLLGITLGVIGYSFYQTATKSSVSKSEAKVHVGVATQSNNQSSYWSATLVGGHIRIDKPLTYTEAQAWVASGNDLLCRDRAAAIAIVKLWPSARHETRHGCVNSGYLNHYHLSSAHGNHIWYMGE